MRSYDNDVSREVYFRYRFSSSPFWVQIGLNHFFGTNEALLSIREVLYTWKTIFQSITDAKNGWKVWVGRRKIKNSSVWTYKNILLCMCSTPKELLRINYRHVSALFEFHLLQHYLGCSSFASSSVLITIEISVTNSSHFLRHSFHGCTLNWTSEWAK